MLIELKLVLVYRITPLKVRLFTVRVGPSVVLMTFCPFSDAIN